MSLRGALSAIPPPRWNQRGAERAAGVAISSAAKVDGLVQVTITAPVDRDMTWALAFTNA